MKKADTKTGQPIAYEKPEIKDFGDLFELTASGSTRGGHDQADANDPEAVKRAAPRFS